MSSAPHSKGSPPSRRRRVEVHTDSVRRELLSRSVVREGRPPAGGAGKLPVTNRDLWERFIAQTCRHDVHWVKVKGTAAT
jgi:ribonuclease HI